MLAGLAVACKLFCHPRRRCRRGFVALHCIFLHLTEGLLDILLSFVQDVPNESTQHSMLAVLSEELVCTCNLWLCSSSIGAIRQPTQMPEPVSAEKWMIEVRLAECWKVIDNNAARFTMSCPLE